MLVMSGSNRLNMIDNVVTLVLNVTLNIVLIPQYGIVGAGMAWAASLAVMNVVKLLQLRRLLGALPFDRTSAKTVAAGLCAAGIALLVRALPPTSGWGLLADVIVVYAAYVIVTLTLRLSPQEISVLREARGIARR